MSTTLSALSESVLVGQPLSECIRSELLTDIFATTVARLPHKIALSEGKQKLTYGELDRKSNQVAHILHQAGIGPRDFVGLWMKRSLDLHIALLGILKAGAAYIPFDAEAPPERISTSLQDCGAKVLIAHQELLEGGLTWAGPSLAWEELLTAHASKKPLEALDAMPDDPAYAIYTSGSTGQPKGIVVSHRNVCHWVRAENHILRVTQEDLVYQGFSLAFDMSVEEIWPAFLVGASLWVAPSELVKATDQLPQVLSQAGVTVLHAVPTLLALLEQDIPSLRLINLGGEACSASLVERWARPARRMLNTYGPTETTVTATWAECQPGQAITIGQPLPNYLAYVLDENLRPLPWGEAGELYLGGPSVTAGYVGRPELTATKFIANPFASTAQQSPMLYRSGDQVYLDDDANLVFNGRIDDQVKVRGYRIELGEIEAQLTAMPAVKAAAVAVKPNAMGMDQLVAYVVLRQGDAWDTATIKAELMARLPAYMVPSLYIPVTVLPTLASGKVDRKKLTALEIPVFDEPSRSVQAPATAIEQELLSAWQELFAQQQLSTTDDFFADLGGHSLLAATLISRLRKQPRYRQLSLQDLYQHPTIAGLAQHLEHSKPIDAPERTGTFHAVPTGRYVACMIAQAVSLLVIYGVFSLQWLVPYLTYSWMLNLGEGIWRAILLALVVYSGLVPAMLGLSIAVKWLVIGRYQPGEYPLWGSYYWRWWFVRRFLAVMPIAYMNGTPLIRIYYRLLGARIGHEVYIGSTEMGATDLISIGDHTSMGYRAMLDNGKVEDGLLKIGAIYVGNHCYIGSSSVLSNGTVLEDYAELDDLSALPCKARIRHAEYWKGSPARFHARVDLASIPAPEAVSTARRYLYAGIFGVLLLVFPILALLPVFPGFMILNELDRNTQDYSYLLITPGLSVLFVLLSVLEIVALRWLFLGRVKEGTYSLYSNFYVRKWLIDQLMESSLSVLHPLYATLYLAPWYRLLGAKIGKRTEISTASAVTHDLLEIDDESFVADAVIMGDPHVRHNRLTLKRTRIGKRSFIGNSALIPDGSSIPDSCLIGCLSQPPQESELSPNTSWFGTPAIYLPKRQTFCSYAPELTYDPPAHLVAMRLVVEFIRIILPITVVMSLSVYFISVMGDLNEVYDFFELALIFPLMYVGFGIVATLVTIALKWLLVGRYRPGAKPMWTPFVWRSELITSTYESLAVTFFLDMLRGTPFLSFFLRLFGSEIGKRVYLDTTDLTEFDVVSIGDDCALNYDCGPQTHLFEDRVMKIAPVTLGDRVVIGTLSIALYDTRLESDSWLGPLSMAMKGEQLPAGTAWFGSPAQPVGDES
jgi:non-ribosomal peptide synthetase-like protein